MTSELQKRKQNLQANRFSLPALLFCLFGFGLVGFSIKSVGFTAKYVKIGLDLCVSSVVPNLFPIMILSDFFLRSGFAEKTFRVFSKTVSKITNLSEESVMPLFFGILFGFPVGVRSTLELYRQNQIAKADAEFLLSVCSIPSAPFLIFTVGESFFSDRLFGCFLFVSCVLSSFLLCAIQQKSRKADSVRFSASVPRKVSVSSAFCKAVTASAQSLFFICAYVVFFSVIVGVFQEFSGIPKVVLAALSAGLEMTNGAKSASLLCGELSKTIAGFAVGWQGISVHFQVLSFCDETNISCKKYFICKLLQGCFCGVCGLCYSLLA